MTETLQKIRAKCVEANPDREWVRHCDHGSIVMPVRFVDVLLAIARHGKSYEVEQGADAHFIHLKLGNVWVVFDLRQDLEKQSPETVDEIGKWLGV